MSGEVITLRSCLQSVPDQKPFPFRIEFPPELPISARSGEIVDALQANSVVIIAGETGSGKTTQIPKICLAAGGGSWGRIACTQPRRVAALSVSKRVAEELNVTWGREVGCKVRFSDQTTRDTVIKFMTDGMLLAEVQSDPLMREYDTIIIDEAHERSLNIDFLLGHLRQLRHKRPELRIVITSATIDTEAFSKAFEDAPIIQVSGRTFPVNVVYEPLDEFGSDEAEGDEPTARPEALHYIDGAVAAIQRILKSSTAGDILVFMPAERDIRETIDLLEGQARGCEMVPLFGRLSNAEQQQVFSTSTRRRIIVATNIAETSLTLPGIRFVVDTGLARLSRYSPQARTRRLPIEAVARSSADQRKGRAGRVAEGLCIRLYSEKDFEARPRFTQPEIQRANLADVILRMKAFGLGDIEQFPFLNMPAAKSIRAGYGLLDELHAMETQGAERRLTEMGRELARLPVDPTVGRMILQAREEKAVREVLIIAAGLSVQDPRERPLDKQAAADAAHRRFTNRDSDFLTLLAIWDALHEEWEKLNQSKMRRWCRDHFLSYTRLREWRDIHAQLMDTMKSGDRSKLTSVWDGRRDVDPAKALGADQPAYRAIHRSVLAGLLSNVAMRDDEKSNYKATHDRRVTIFPGSGLAVKEDRKALKGAKGSAAKMKGPRWLMAAEIVETSRLYARTCALLDPRWMLDLAEHLLKIEHSEPFWDEVKGRVMVRQRTRLYGLEIESKAVSFGIVDPVAATEIFIREALVNDTITWPFDFLLHNREVRSAVENQLTRTRDRGVMNLDEAVFRYYATVFIAGKHTVSAVGELIALVKERKPHEPQFLEFKEDDLRDPEEDAVDPNAFPENVPLQQGVLPLNYCYKPGQVDDGVTLDVQVAAASDLTVATLDWAVPGHLPHKVEHYLKSLPKELRRAVMPLAATAKLLVPQLQSRDRLTGRRETLVEALAVLLGERFQLRISPSVWDERPLPDFLRVRVCVKDGKGEEIVASRELKEIEIAVAAHEQEMSRTAESDEPAMWRRACQRWETEPLENWPGEALPSEVVIGETNGVEVKAYPILKDTADGLVVKLLRTADAAERSRPAGLRAMLAQALRYELAWTEKDLRAMKQVGPMAATLATVETLQADAMVGVAKWATDPKRIAATDGGYRREQFETAVIRAKTDLRGVVQRLIDQVKEILELRQALLVHPQPFGKLARDLADLVSPRFLRDVPFGQLQHFPRYLKAMIARADRWQQNQAKDEVRAGELKPFEAALDRLAGKPEAAVLRWMVEELRVSLFAQHLGTAEPVSTKKLSLYLEAYGESSAPGAPAATATKPSPLAVTPLAGKTKAKPLKSLDSLAGLFRR
jgi:ATP-dependent helicase HrpA